MRLRKIAAGLLVSTAATAYCVTAFAATDHATCDDACLRKLVDSYFVALVAHDPGKAPIAPGARFVENTAPTRIGAGLWETASQVPGAFRIYVPDPSAQQVGFIGVLEEQGRPIEIGLRLKVAAGKITEIEQIVVHTLRETGLKNLGSPRAAFLTPVPPAERTDHDRMLKIGASYYEAIVTSNGKAAPFAADCVRHENGMQTNANPPPATPGFGTLGALGCADQLNSGVMSYIKRIEPRRVWIADVNTGLVFGMSQFRHPMKEKTVPIAGVAGVDHVDMAFAPFDLPAMHIFKIRGGKIHEIEALGFMAPYESKTGLPPAPQPQPPPVCTRQTLQTAVDSYLAAQKAGDRTKMAFGDKAKYLENMSEVAADKGKWNTAVPIALSRSFLDKDRCRTFSEVIVTEGPTQYVIGTRLSVDNGRITAIDSLVSHKGDWLFNANSYLKYSRQEDWKVPQGATPATMVELINAANNYLDLFSDKAGKIPWGKPCARLEGGAYTNRDGDANATCEVGIPPGVLYIVNRDYVVDEEQGVINVFCRFGNSSTGMPDSHTFRLVNGRIRNVHTISINLTPEKPSPQADDNGAILR